MPTHNKRNTCFNCQIASFVRLCGVTQISRNKYGVPQGSVLGLLLDSSNTCTPYADDIKFLISRESEIKKLISSTYDVHVDRLLNSMPIRNFHRKTVSPIQSNFK